MSDEKNKKVTRNVHLIDWGYAHGHTGVTILH